MKCHVGWTFMCCLLTLLLAGCHREVTPVEMSQQHGDHRAQTLPSRVLYQGSDEEWHYFAVETGLTSTVDDRVGAYKVLRAELPFGDEAMAYTGDRWRWRQCWFRFVAYETGEDGKADGIEWSFAKPFVMENRKDGRVALVVEDPWAHLVGKLVQVEGTVTNTKIPLIHGIDVRSDDPDLRGKVAVASGILERRTVTAEDMQRMIKEGIAHRGVGTFYRLRDPGSQRTAQVQPEGTPVKGHLLPFIR